MTNAEFEAALMDEARRAATALHIAEAMEWVPYEMVNDEGIQALITERTRDFVLESMGIDFVAHEFNKLLGES